MLENLNVLDEDCPLEAESDDELETSYAIESEDEWETSYEGESLPPRSFMNIAPRGNVSDELDTVLSITDSNDYRNPRDLIFASLLDLGVLVSCWIITTKS